MEEKKFQFQDVVWKYTDQVRWMSGSDLIFLLTDLAVARSNPKNPEELTAHWDQLIAIVEAELDRRRETG